MKPGSPSTGLASSRDRKRSEPRGFLLTLLLALSVPSGLYLIFPIPKALASKPEDLFVPQPDLPAPGPNLKQTANFDDLRHNVLGLLSGGKKRIWLLTDYLTDGDIVSALFLAKYRKVDVKVFLGQSHLNSYMSRLNYLKAQNVPVFERPEHGYIAPTILLIDQRLFTINRDLNTLARGGAAQLAQASPTEVVTFVNWFKEVVNYPIAVEAKPLPAVGRAGGSKPSRGGSQTWQNPTVSSYEGESNGSYNYDRSGLSRRTPEGISTKLPRTLRWQKPAAEKAPEPVPDPAKKFPESGSIPSGEAGAVEAVKQGPKNPSEISDPNRPRPDEETFSPPSEER